MTKVDVLLTRYAHLTNMKIQALEQSLRLHDPELYEIYLHEFKELQKNAAVELERFNEIIREFENV